METAGFYALVWTTLPERDNQTGAVEESLAVYEFAVKRHNIIIIVVIVSIFLMTR